MWWDRFLTNLTSHPGGMAYSPAQGIAIGAVALVWLIWMVRKGLRTGAFPRAFTPPGKERLLRREKEPAAFRRNLWTGVAMVVVAVIAIAISLALAVNPNL